MNKRLFFALAMSAFMVASCNGNNADSNQGNPSSDGNLSVSSNQDFSSVDPISYSEYSVESTSRD